MTNHCVQTPCHLQNRSTKCIAGVCTGNTYKECGKVWTCGFYRATEC